MKRIYTDHNKRAVVQLLNTGRSQRSVSKESGASSTTLRRWRNDPRYNPFREVKAERDAWIKKYGGPVRHPDHLDVIRERDALKAQLEGVRHDLERALAQRDDALKAELAAITAERDAEPTEATQALDALDYQMKANKALENDIEARKRIIERLLHYLALLPRVKPEETTYEGSLMGLKLNED